jgi:hypothetical protein
MGAMRILAAVLAAVVTAAAPNCAAAPFVVPIGDARLVLDSPPGFSDTTFTGSPRLQELAEQLTAASNRILLFALTDADLRRFTVGDPIEAKRYMVAVTPRGIERERITAKVFSAYVVDSLRELGELPKKPAADYRDYLDRQDGRPALLAELRREAEVVSMLQGARLAEAKATGEPAKYMLSTTTLLLLRGKALNLTVYGAYETPADLDWIRLITTRWIEELQRLNVREGRAQ